MKPFQPLRTLITLALVGGACASSHAAVFTEDFEGTFPAWEGGWFGTQSDANNYYCGARGCTDRGNNPDGLWLYGLANQPIEVNFNQVFGQTLTSLTLDVAGFVPTTLKAYDSSNVEIFSQNVVLTSGAFVDPGIYSTYTISSGSGISRFTFDGNAAGNTSIDNLVAVTSSAPVPEPETYAMLLAGLGVLGFVGKCRKVS